MKYLIVNADDLGLNPGVNRGILESYRRGIVRSTTAMANMADFPAAVEGLREVPGLGVGIHFNLTEGQPVSDPGRIPSLVDANGFFQIATFFEDSLSTPQVAPEEIAVEFRAQLVRFLEAGLYPTHLDTHHHIHGFPVVLKEIVDLARELKAAVRCLSARALRQMGFNPVSRHLKYDGSQDALQRLLQKLESLSEGTTEIVCHPGYGEYRRLQELEALTHPETGKAIERLGIRLVHYGTLPGDK